MKKLLALLFFVLSAFCYSSYADNAVTHVVYHIDETQTQGLKALRNIRNHLDVSPKTKIIVVAHANGVEMLMEGVRDQKTGTEYAPLVSALKSSGVTFEVCETTLRNKNLKKSQFILDADFTPSGVVRLADLQYSEHFAYIKP
jgi:intracellular sulfur oxidation DsrE/DsrF family protein